MSTGWVLQVSSTRKGICDGYRDSRSGTLLAKALTLIKHKADQALQGQYTKEQLLGIILKTARQVLLDSEVKG